MIPFAAIPFGVIPLATALEQWGIMVAMLTAAIGFAATAISAAGAYRTLGRMEGKIERYGARLQNHSDTLKDHDAVLLRLEFLPTSVRDMKKEIHAIKGDVESIKKSLEKVAINGT